MDWFIHFYIYQISLNNISDTSFINETYSFHSSQYIALPGCIIKTAATEIAFFNGIDKRIIQTITKGLNRLLSVVIQTYKIITSFVGKPICVKALMVSQRSFMILFMNIPPRILVRLPMLRFEFHISVNFAFSGRRIFKQVYSFFVTLMQFRYE